jgi:Cu(I)/Ag(I) efflux system membrane fusion protein
MKRITSLLERWRSPRTGGGPPDAGVTEKVVRPRRTIWIGVAAGVLLVTVAGVVGLLAWDEPPTPEPAVPPGQLAREMEAEHAANPTGAVTIDQTMAERLGLQTAVVEERALDARLQTTGQVTPDERRIARVNTKVDGWIEQTFASFEGQEIRKGQPLFTIYSPDLVATQQELLLALRARKSFEKSEFETVRGAGDSLVEVARRRLELWDVTPKQIAEIERTGKAVKSLTVYAPASGVIVERKAFPGIRVMPDTDLYTLADLSTIWVEAAVFESDLPAVRTGTTAEVTLPGGEVRAGRVAYVNPFVDAQSRTASVRVELPNPGLALKPGMFVSVSLQTAGASRLAVPRDAVIDTGARKLVLVDAGDGRFVLREIRTGEQGAELYTVLSGLTAGERVARNAQFLVDSETPLREALEQFPSSGAGKGSAEASPSMPGMPGMEHPK